METLTTALQVGIVVELSVLLLIGLKAVALLERILKRLKIHPGVREMSNYSTWTYRDGGWQMVEDLSEPEYMPYAPQARAGAYPEETVWIPSVRKPGAGQ